MGLKIRCATVNHALILHKLKWTCDNTNAIKLAQDINFWWTCQSSAFHYVS